MRYLALATDYDGTLAHHGAVSDATWAAVKRLRDSGRKALLVTGREPEDLQTVCPRLDLFDLVVAENGALLYRPATRELRPLALLTPVGRTMTAPLLKMTCSSRPRSWMAARTADWCGSQVATMAWPTETGPTPRRRSSWRNASGGLSASGRTSRVAGW